ncbi:MAG: YARHG domain-containing protein [Clostridia bacterium]|nr:YARHG domain-containing protein [Clostridia bacterium]
MAAKKKKKTAKLIVCIFCAVLFVATGVFCYIFYSSGRNLQTIDLNNYTYLNITKSEDGTYGIALNYDKVVDAEYLPRADRSGSGKFLESNYPELALLKAIDFNVEQTEAGMYEISTVIHSDTMNAQQVSDILTKAGLKLTNTQWTWSAQTMETAYLQSQGANPSTDPSTEPSTEPSTSIEPDSTVAPSSDSGDAPSQTPLPSETATPEPSEETTQAPVAAEGITTLYGYDQTDLRKAIRSAKENYYSSAYRESEVVYNYFIVGKTDTAEYVNCFRLVLRVTTSGGTEYMVADVYNIQADVTPTRSDVVIKTYTSASQARGTSDFNSSLYDIYTLDGGSMVFSENSGKSPFNSDGLVFSDSLENYITTAQLWNIPATSQRSLLSLLGYARNEIFARCGHKFRDTSSYRTYYLQFDWYEPIGSVSYNDVGSRYPRACTNIDTIKELEDLIEVG